MVKTEDQIRDELNREAKELLARGSSGRIVRVGDESPFDEGATLAKGERGAANLYGAFSIQKFCDQGSLTHTHEDARGWLAYVEKFNPRNFWYQDGNVQPWAYYEQYDNYLDTYGIDAPRAVYHSGHGGMGNDGKFYAPMGASWGGLGCTVATDPSRMGLGNEKVRYIFWSTCVSCRVLGGQSPIKTWNPVHKGFRMLFGFETTSWDSPDYGKFFWEEWNKNKSFSTAWLDASWRIAHDMAPSVVACGATQQEASDRVFNERYFSASPASNAWWWWRWYNVATAAREPNLALPTELLAATLRPSDLSEDYVRTISGKLNIEAEVPKGFGSTGRVIFSGEGDLQVAFGRDGSYEMQLAKPDLSKKEPINLGLAISKAEGAISRFRLDRDINLVLDLTRAESEAGSSKSGEKIEGPYTTQTTIQFKQLINGLPVIAPGAGDIRVSIDNAGSISLIQSAVRPVELLTNRQKQTTLAPPPPDQVPVGMPRWASRDSEYERLLNRGWQERLTSIIIRGTLPVQYAIVPGSTEIGYDIQGNDAVLSARRAIEVDYGNGYLKRYWVITPLTFGGTMLN